MGGPSLLWPTATPTSCRAWCWQATLAGVARPRWPSASRWRGLVAWRSASCCAAARCSGAAPAAPRRVTIPPSSPTSVAAGRGAAAAILPTSSRRAGRCRTSTPGHGRPSTGTAAAVVLTTEDRVVRPAKQRALAAAVGASVFELDGDHFAFWAKAKEFADVTRQVARRRGQPSCRRQPGCRATRSAFVTFCSSPSTLVEVRRGDHVGQRQADAGDLAGEELGVGLHPGAARADRRSLWARSRVLLAVLGQQDQRRGVGGLQRQTRVRRMSHGRTGRTAAALVANAFRGSTRRRRRSGTRGSGRCRG